MLKRVVSSSYDVRVEQRRGFVPEQVERMAVEEAFHYLAEMLYRDWPQQPLPTMVAVEVVRSGGDIHARLTLSPPSDDSE